MTASEPVQALAEEFHRRDTPGVPFFSPLSASQNSTSAMTSSALLVSGPEQSTFPEQELGGGPSSGSNDTSETQDWYMTYSPSRYPQSYSNYTATCPPDPFETPSAINFGENQDVIPSASPAGPAPALYSNSSSFGALDPSIPRSISSPSWLDVNFPPGYQPPDLSDPTPLMTTFSSLHDSGYPDWSLTSHCPSTLVERESFRHPRPGEGGMCDPSADKTEPYAKLIHRCLMQAPNKEMVLRDIYNWFKSNTNKAADKRTKGWQNSIRHNLSMNGAFQKVEVPAGGDQKKGNMWRLTPEAVRDGVKSTTRYRLNNKSHRSKASCSDSSSQRADAGKKGGLAARHSRQHRFPEVDDCTQYMQDLSMSRSLSNISDLVPEGFRNLTNSGLEQRQWYGFDSAHNPCREPGSTEAPTCNFTMRQPLSPSPMNPFPPSFHQQQAFYAASPNLSYVHQIPNAAQDIFSASNGTDYGFDMMAGSPEYASAASDISEPQTPIPAGPEMDDTGTHRFFDAGPGTTI
ncbi:hypothetical protein IWX49DRAFT_322597 [Phyllosticta citricarpa]|uniref:Fork-head domain-containing protein n=2 Tax=Phyllosticta TaxID=121621 RepID=A0ABR1M4Y8_9PEZI